MSDSEGKIAALLRKHLADKEDRKALQTPKFCYLDVKTTGKGAGTVTRNPEAERYEKGTIVSLTANAQAGSKFIRWKNDVIGSHPICNLRMDTTKSVYAEFEIEELRTSSLQKYSIRTNPLFLSLGVTITGLGCGIVVRTPDNGEYEQGSLVSLKAVAAEDSVFNGWRGDVIGGSPICNLRMDSSKYITADFVQREFFLLDFITKGTGSGRIVPYPDQINYEKDRIVLLNAYPAEDSIFKGWIGEWYEDNGNVVVKMNATKTISAIFEKIPLFSLNIIKNGDGFGTITRNPDKEFYLENSVVELTACASDRSKFNGWNGNSNDLTHTFMITMNSAKSTTAEFVKIESFTLDCAREGSGDGSVNWVIQRGKTLETPEVTRFIEGSVATLTATPSEGSKFKCWHGDVTGVLPTCTITFASSKSITAEFVRREFFALSVATVGTGSGAITQSPDFEEYAEDSIVTLTAEAEEGSIFNGWQGDAAGMDTSCTLAMDSAKRVTADFMKLDVSDLGIEVRFDSVEDARMKNGEDALILSFSIANNEPKQVRVELPMASYVTGQGEEIEQSAWLSNLLLGNKGSMLRAGTFRKMGLIFYKSRLAEVTPGDDLHITVLQTKPARRLCFTFRCIDQELRQFRLIKTGAALTHALDENGETSLEKLEILQRLTLLEDGMRDILQRLDALQLAPVHTNARLEPTRTLPEVLAWLATQSRISVATLRVQLLPLDLLPNALIDDINERAYDLAGEAALDDDGDAVTVQRDVLLQVLAAWDE